MKLHFLTFYFVSILFIPDHLIAQNFSYQVEYKPDLNNHLNTIGATSDSGVITSAGVGPNLKLFNLTKFDKLGLIQWSKTYGSTLNSMWVYNPIQLRDGNILTVGQALSNIFALKTDSNGDIIWSKIIGTSNYNEFALRSIEGNSNNYYLSGGSALNNWHFQITNIDSAGNIIWAKKFGSNSSDNNYSFTRLSDGGFAMIGSTEGFGIGAMCDYYVVRLDSLGNILWSRTLGGSSQDIGRAILQTHDDGLILAGNSASFGNSWSGLIIKLDINGNFLWAKNYTPFLDLADILPGDNGFILSGSSMFKIDSIGNVIWNYTYGNGYQGQACITTNKDISTSLFQLGDTFKLVRTDPNGISCFQNSINLTANNVALTIDSPTTILYPVNLATSNFILPDSNIVPFSNYYCNPLQSYFNTPQTLFCNEACINFINFSQNTITYQWYFPGATPDTSTAINPTNICYTTPGSYDVTLIASNSNGSDTLTLQNYITVFPPPPPQSITQYGDTLFAIAGAASYQWYFNGNIINGATDYFYIATASGDYNVVATDVNGCEVEAVINNVIAAVGSGSRQSIQIYPNPVFDKFTIHDSQFTIGTANTEISIYNLFGEKIDLAFNREPLTVDCRPLPSGLYFLELKADEKIFRSKFVKQ